MLRPHALIEGSSVFPRAEYLPPEIMFVPNHSFDFSFITAAVCICTNIRTNINTCANPTRYYLEDIMCLVAQFTHNCQQRSAKSNICNIYLNTSDGKNVSVKLLKNNIYFWAVNVFGIDQTVQNKNFTQVLIVCCVRVAISRPTLPTLSLSWVQPLTV